ncbi:Lactation elevated protein 1 [Thoreauomyces humboldtii]|nr:Lactation elevated protein 1 [Thoreauomyces humboldtii]
MFVRLASPNGSPAAVRIRPRTLATAAFRHATVLPKPFPGHTTSLHGITSPIHSSSSSSSSSILPPTTVTTIPRRPFNSSADSVHSTTDITHGPAAYYASLIESNVLRPDPHQQTTVDLLQDLHDRISDYVPPSIQEPDVDPDLDRHVHEHKGKADMLSPDFAWVKHDEESFLDKRNPSLRPRSGPAACREAALGLLTREAGPSYGPRSGPITSSSDPRSGSFSGSAKRSGPVPSREAAHGLSTREADLLLGPSTSAQAECSQEDHPCASRLNKRHLHLLLKVFSVFSKKKIHSAVVEQQGPTGLYLYGDVGTGKTMTMDLFYNAANFPRKRRVHFHAFMQDVHKRIHKLRVEKGVTYDPLPIIATELINDAWLLCFDELQVTDITDAMILRRLFDELFRRGMVMVTTSNRHPDELYQNGIQRQSFLPTIALLKERCKVHSLNSGIDYRKEVVHMELKPALVSFREILICFGADVARPLNNATRRHVDAIFKNLTKGHDVGPETLHFLGRTLSIPLASTSASVCSLPFSTICGEPHSAADYLAVVSRFRTILLTDIPRMTLDHRNEARRFITFIDAMYENKTKLLISAETDIKSLFTGEEGARGSGVGAGERLLMDDLKLTTEHLTSAIFTGSEEVFAFQRAVSRLIEMQSLQWLGEDLRGALGDRVL